MVIIYVVSGWQKSELRPFLPRQRHRWKTVLVSIFAIENVPFAGVVRASVSVATVVWNETVDRIAAHEYKT